MVAGIKNSIIKKIGLTIFFFIIIMFVAYYSFLNVQIKTYLEQQGKEQLVKESQVLCAEIEMFLQKYIIIVEQGKNNPDFIALAKEIDSRHTKRAHPLFSKVVHQLEDINQLDKNISQPFIALTKVDDIVTSIYNYEISPDYELSEREWYLNTIKENKTTITTPYVDLITNKTAVTIAAPLIEDGAVLGAFGIDILIQDLNEIMKDYNANANVDVGLIYKTGQVLYDPNINVSLEPADVFIQELLDEKVVDEILSGKNGIAHYQFQGAERYIAYFPVGNTDLIVFTNILQAQILAPVHKFLYINLSILAGLIFVTLLLLYFVQRMISRPIVGICAAVEDYTNDNLVSLPKEYLNRRDEIGVLSKGINLMLYRISNYISALEEKNKELINAKEIINGERILFKTTLRSLGDGVISTDRSGNIQVMNTVAEKLTGWTNSEAIGLPFGTVFHIINEHTGQRCPDPIKRTIEMGKINELDECTLLINKNGKQIPIEDSAAPILDKMGNITGAVIVFRDYTDKKQRQDEISYLSYHDQLTGLHNRHFFEKELKRLDCEKTLPLSLVMLDVNGLKLTNDAFGHQMGDKLLQSIAVNIRKVCRESDAICRIGGDEFILLLPNTTYDETELIVKRIYREIEKSELENIVISLSIGWETKTQIEQDIMEVYAKAEDSMYRKKIIESQSMRNKTIQIIINTLNETNHREKIHSENVSIISRKIAEVLGLDQEMLQEIETAGLLHDIGKITIDSSLLDKPGTLTNVEYEMIKKHAEVGYQILKSVDAYSNLSDSVLSHHERWDGAGYPRGLKGEDIPLVARIITVADAYEAMTAKRTYRETISKKEAVNELVRCAGTQFDPAIIKAFCEHYDAF